MGDAPDPTRAALGRAGDATTGFAVVVDVRRVSSAVAGVADGFAELSAPAPCLTFFYSDVRLIRVFDEGTTNLYTNSFYSTAYFAKDNSLGWFVQCT